MAVYRIPLSSNQQIFEIDLKSKTYRLRNYFNKFMGTWCIDLMDENGKDIIKCQPLVTGSNIFDQYRYLGIGGIFLVLTDGDYDHLPDLDELGTTTNVYFLMEAER